MLYIYLHKNNTCVAFTACSTHKPKLVYIEYNKVDKLTCKLILLNIVYLAETSSTGLATQ